MRILFTLIALLSTTANAAICSRTMTFVDGAVLSAAQLNAEFNSITNCANSLDDANIISSANILPEKIDATIISTNGGISRDINGRLSINADGTSTVLTGGVVKVGPLGVDVSMLAADSVSTAKIQNDAVTTAKILDGSVTQEKLASGVNTAFLKTQTFTTASSTWVAPTGVTSVVAFGCGGGGGGGASVGNGGHGVVGHSVPFTVIPGNSYTVVVGSGGAGGIGSSNGSFGGASYVFDGVNYLATFFGGFGGAGNGAVDAESTKGPAVTDGGHLANSGQASFSFFGGSSNGQAGGGGAGEFGVGGNGASGNGIAGSSAGANTCAGGGGGGGISASGGNGGSGKIVLMWVGP